MAELSIDAEVYLVRIDAARRSSKSSGWPPLGNRTLARCSVRRTSRWPSRPKHGGWRAALVAEAGPAQDQATRRGLWRRRMGRRDRPTARAAVDRLSSGDQRISRPAHGRIARGRFVARGANAELPATSIARGLAAPMGRTIMDPASEADWARLRSGRDHSPRGTASTTAAFWTPWPACRASDLSVLRAGRCLRRSGLADRLRPDDQPAGDRGHDEPGVAAAWR